MKRAVRPHDVNAKPGAGQTRQTVRSTRRGAGQKKGGIN